MSRFYRNNDTKSILTYEDPWLLQTIRYLHIVHGTCVSALSSTHGILHSLEKLCTCSRNNGTINNRDRSTIWSRVTEIVRTLTDPPPKKKKNRHTHTQNKTKRKQKYSTRTVNRVRAEILPFVANTLFSSSFFVLPFLLSFVFPCFVSPPLDSCSRFF